MKGHLDKLELHQNLKLFSVTDAIKRMNIQATE